MLYCCRCGNFRVQAIELCTGSPNKSEWLAFPSAETTVCWKFLSLNVTRQITNGPRCKYYFCVLCSAWIIGERADNVVLINKPYFSALADDLSVPHSASQQYKFLAPKFVENDSLITGVGVQAETSALKAVGHRYLEDERGKTKNRIEQFEREEWAKFESTKLDAEHQLDILEKNLLDAYDIVRSTGFHVLPSETFSAGSLLSPDDGFAQTEDDDPPREWRGVAPRSNDLTEADVFEVGSSDESGNDLGLPLSAVPETGRESQDKETRRSYSANKPEAVYEATIPSDEGRTAAMPLPVTSNSAGSDARFMLSRSQPRAIPTSHTAYGRTAPTFALGFEEENTGEDEDRNVARAIQMLARSIVSDGTELFAPSAAHDYEEVGS